MTNGQVRAECRKRAVLAPILARLGAKIVIDHFGVPEKSVTEDPGLQAIVRAVDGRAVRNGG